MPNRKRGKESGTTSEEKKTKRERKKTSQSTRTAREASQPAALERPVDGEDWLLSPGRNHVELHLVVRVAAAPAQHIAIAAFAGGLLRDSEEVSSRLHLLVLWRCQACK